MYLLFSKFQYFYLSINNALIQKNIDMESQSSQPNILSEIITDNPSINKRTLHLTLPDDSPKINFGNISIPRCQFCNAYISKFCRKKQKKLSDKISYKCAFCQKQNQYPQHIPVQFQQIPNNYKVEILPHFEQKFMIDQSIPELVLLIDRSFPFFEALKNALPDALEKFDKVFDVTVLIYCRGLSYCKLDSDGKGIQYIVQHKTFEHPDQSPIFQKPKSIPNKNNEIFRENLKILLEILQQQQQQRQKTTQNYFMKHNGPQFLNWTRQYLFKSNCVLKRHLLWFGWTPMFTLRECYQTYQYNIFVSCFLAQNQLKPLSKIILQKFIQDKYSVKLLHDITNWQKSAQQLHYSIHELLSQSRILNCRQSIHSRNPGSTIAYNSYKQILYDKKYGILIQEKIYNQQKHSKKIKTLKRGRRINNNIIQVLLYYLNFEGQQILEVVTFDHNSIIQTEHINRYMLMHKTLNGYPYFNENNPQFVCESSKYFTEILNFIVRFQSKDKKYINQMNRTWIQIHFGIRKMDLNTMYMIWPILYTYDSTNRLFFCYRWSYKVGQAQISWADCIEYYANISKSFYSYFQQDPPKKLPIFDCLKEKHYFQQHHSQKQLTVTDPQNMQQQKERQIDMNASCLFISQYYDQDYDDLDYDEEQLFCQEDEQFIPENEKVN